MNENKSFCDLLDEYLDWRDEVKIILESENRGFSHYKDERDSKKEAREALDTFINNIINYRTRPLEAPIK